MYLLPQMGTENLDERDLKRRDLAMQEDTGQIQLDLEPNVNVGSINRGRPPKGEATVRDLVKTGALGVGELLEFHRFFEARSFLPEEPFPGWERGSLEQSVLEDGLDTTKCLNDISAVGIQIPQFAVVALASPPKGVTLTERQTLARV